METLPVAVEKMPILEHEPEEVMEKVVKVANVLKDVVTRAGLSKDFGGGKPHLYFEAWQTVAGFFSHSVNTFDAMPVEVDGVKGFKAKAVLFDRDGREVGGAEAYCMRDEKNWANKPSYQLASMSQTRAGSKAFREKFGWVAVLGGYAGTPAEEMDGVHNGGHEGQREMEQGGYEEMPEEPPSHPSPSPDGITDKQRGAIFAISKALGINHLDACFKALGRPVEHLERLTKKEAGQVIESLQKERDRRRG